MVSSYPKARRKGYVKKLMLHLFNNMKEKGQVVSTLYPFKESFYERLGYITLPRIRIARFSPEVLKPLLSLDLKGKIERKTFKDGFDEYLTILKEMQKRIHGLTIKPQSELERIKAGRKWWIAIARDEEVGELIGFMTYTITKFWGTMKIHNFYYKNSEAKYLLLQWAAKHIDQVKEVELTVRPDEHLESWFSDSEAKIATREWIASPMGRIVSVEDLSGMCVGTGEFTAKIIDPQCEWNNKHFRFVSKDGVLEVEEIENSECTLTIQGLSALIYGGYDSYDFKYRGWGDPSSQVVEKMIKLFPEKLAFIHSEF
ncbi:MAG: GNAT family N-acetyltransferase [Candidatus Heimdallarchaeaceae archaeon]